MILIRWHRAHRLSSEHLSNKELHYLFRFVMIVAIDIVSGERSDGTMKMLLTRPIRRWKILLSKYVTMLFFISLILFLVGLFAYILSGLVFGYSGWNLPVLTGFVIDKETLNTNFATLFRSGNTS